MSRENPDELERELAALTRWAGGDVQAWRGALAADGRPNGGADFKRFWSRRAASWAMIGVAAAALLLIVVPVLHSTGSRVQARKGNDFRYSSVQSPAFERSSLIDAVAPDSPKSDGLVGGFDGRFISPSEGVVADSARNAEGSYFSGGTVSSENPEGLASHVYVSNADEKKAKLIGPVSGPDRSAAGAERHVIRKATIELRAVDVRAAFLKASHLVSEAHGEYVQESSLTGGDQRLEGNLTLRVAADRLSAVLQALRELGTVRAETAGGEDVTTQVVDLEARLSNENRVEAELLQLMEKRIDAPLKEVLELRSAIGSVRQTIETMTAQRERLSRLVSLATVLVIIRPADAAAEPTPPGLWDYFTSTVARATERGVQALINTVAGLILVVVGGAIWIVLIAVAVVVVVRRLRVRSPA